MKNIFKTVIIVALGISITGCDLFSGILFPRIRFSFSQEGESPPLLAQAKD